MKVLRKIIEIDEDLCDGCGQCITGCAEGALEIVEGKAKVVADKYCDGLGACIGECPTGALCIVEREAEDFDEEAVEERLAELEKAGAPAAMHKGCPSAQVHVFAPDQKPKDAIQPAEKGTAAPPRSELTHWPIQIRLIPPHAPFLKNADLLVLADCSAVAYANLHEDLVKDKVVMMGCPKFDDAQEYIDRFADIFKTAGVNSVTTVYMEVPCCSGLPTIVRKGMEKAGVKVPVTDVVVSRKGEQVTDRPKMARLA